MALPNVHSYQLASFKKGPYRKLKKYLRKKNRFFFQHGRKWRDRLGTATFDSIGIGVWITSGFWFWWWINFKLWDYWGPKKSKCKQIIFDILYPLLPFCVLSFLITYKSADLKINGAYCGNIGYGVSSSGIYFETQLLQDLKIFKKVVFYAIEVLWSNLSLVLYQRNTFLKMNNLLSKNVLIFGLLRINPSQKISKF